LAFAAQWCDAPANTTVFSVGEPADAVYLCLSGKAEIVFSDDTGKQHHVSTVEPGRVSGNLAVIVREGRQANLKAIEDTRFLRIGADEFRSVIEDDTTVLMNLLKTVAGYLNGAATVLRDAQLEIPRDPPEDES
jgi:putative ABC transport system ATP-binding protein